MADDNKKLPVGPWCEGEIEPKYPYVHGSADHLGGHELKYRNINEPDKSSSQTLTPSGSYSTTQADGNKKEIKTKLSPGEIRDYAGGGRSKQTDGHKDDNNESTTRQTTKGDQGIQRGGNYYHGTGKKKIGGSKDGEFNIVTGSSESTSYSTSKGHTVTEHSGNKHSSHEGDDVASVKGNKVTMVKDGDYAIHVQGGNMDTQVEQKGRIKSKNDLLIESDTKITLKVGSSTITITSSNITIKSDRVDINP